MVSRTRMWGVGVAVIAALCGCGSDSDGSGDSDAASDSHVVTADSVSDPDSDRDAVPDLDAEADSVPDLDAEADSVPDLDAEADSIPDPDSTADTDTAADTEIVAECGDRIRAASEACDDGDRDDGDGCSADCTIEAGHAFEVEPNDTPASLTAAFACAADLHATLASLADPDVFALALQDPTTLTIDVLDADAACPDELGVRLFLVAPDGTTVLAEDDGDAEGCPRIAAASHVGARALPAGTYYVIVVAAGPATSLPLDVRVRVTRELGLAALVPELVVALDAALHDAATVCVPKLADVDCFPHDVDACHQLDCPGQALGCAADVSANIVDATAVAAGEDSVDLVLRARADVSVPTRFTNSWTGQRSCFIPARALDPAATAGATGRLEGGTRALRLDVGTVAIADLDVTLNVSGCAYDDILDALGCAVTALHDHLSTAFQADLPELLRAALTSASLPTAGSLLAGVEPLPELPPADDCAP